mmetsp:Transcript_65101/g.169399  ORF Transcript_65101/g.169399 Transcript_65101/m.169399 type:complete len:218 (-) Transcript_65101:817-1470(-)
MLGGARREGRGDRESAKDPRVLPERRGGPTAEGIPAGERPGSLAVGPRRGVHDLSHEHIGLQGARRVLPGAGPVRRGVQRHRPGRVLRDGVLVEPREFHRVASHLRHGHADRELLELRHQQRRVEGVLPGLAAGHGPRRGFQRQDLHPDAIPDGLTGGRQGCPRWGSRRHEALRRVVENRRRRRRGQVGQARGRHQPGCQIRQACRGRPEGQRRQFQ